MPAHSGEHVRETGDFRCERCREQVHVTKGGSIPKGPTAAMAPSTPAPGNKSR